MNNTHSRVTATGGNLIIYDATLRDGTQGEGFNLSLEDKLEIARALDRFGIPYIEGGWPGSNPKDARFFEAMKSVELQSSKLAAFSFTRAWSETPADTVGTISWTEARFSAYCSSRSML